MICVGVKTSENMVSNAIVSVENCSCWESFVYSSLHEESCATMSRDTNSIPKNEVNLLFFISKYITSLKDIYFVSLSFLFS